MTTLRKITRQAEILDALRDGAVLRCEYQTVSSRQVWSIGQYTCLTRPCVALELRGAIRKTEDIGTTDERHETWVLA